MKRLWISLGLLLLFFTATLCHSAHLKNLSEELNALLTQAEVYAEAEDWQSATALTQQAHEIWQAEDTYLHILLRHDDTDEVYTYFREVQEFIDAQKQGEYAAANAHLIAKIALLYEAEALSLKNVF